MVEINQVYKCIICGDIVEILHGGIGELACCNQPMELLPEKNQDKGQEKHVPVVEKTETGIKVMVGSVPHPMEPDHYIEWIEVISDGKSFRQFLKPLGKPEAEFKLQPGEREMTIREYCNLHGLWKA